ncbi:hypothetical protein [Sinanaerobacter sp. ZZT-01]|uniref:hypothetical protein n=1 Tax=Sinanaerobacter sp. ZZT-01 TaxID=3111540 RepID=UPI002D76E4B2|nr:hypothetical protein [Sinanaerobacter sp. ZZT-01]WRR93091.1 hypothetical protein U5921_13790 [Sinanaerobacter sp. ZZT-01]
MYQRYKFIVVPCIAILLISIFSGFGRNSESVNVRHLIEQRTDILQQSYYGELPLEKAQEQLQKIETQPLLGEDITALRAADPCQLDLVQKMEMKSIERRMRLFHYQSFEVNLKWYMKGLNEDYISQGDYFIVLKTVDGEAKISEFEPILADFEEN